MKRTPAILLCLVGLFAGVVTGRMLPRAAAGQTTSANASPDTAAGSSPAGRGSPAKHAKEQKHDLPSLLKKWSERGSYAWNPAAQREIERMSAPALRQLIEGMTVVFSDTTKPESSAAHQIIVLASMELYRRDGEAALEWASTSTGDRQLMMTWMLSEAAIDSPDLAKRWIEKMEKAEGFHEGWWQNAVYSALAGARARGADDLLRLYESYGTRIPEHAYASGAFPPGFEYEKLFTSVGAKVSLTDMVQYWSATDRDAAWKSVKEMIDAEGKGVGYSGSLFAGAAAVQGGENAAKWLIPKLEELPEAKRIEAVQSLTGGVLSPESIGSIMATLTRESDRIALAKPFVNVGANSGQDLAALRGLSSDASRSVVLIAAANNHAAAIPNAEPRHVKAIRDYFRKTMEALDLPKDSQAEVMEVLEAPAKNEPR